jgi:hypothetical protein
MMQTIGLALTVALCGSALLAADGPQGQAKEAPHVAMKRYPLEHCDLEVGSPVEVGRAKSHFWFPSLHGLGGRNVLCAATVADDKAQGKWPAVLHLSRDGGATWSRIEEKAFYGPTSVRLGEGRLLLMPYEVWPVAPGDRRNAKAEGTLFTLKADGTLAASPALVQYLGFPADLADYYQGELYLLTNGNILTLRDGRLFTTVYGRLGKETKDCTFAVTSDHGGLTWRFRSVVARWQDIPGATEGANESNTVGLADGRLLCVYRTGSGQKYCKSYSADDGATWTTPSRMEGVWSVEPQLVRLPNGLILLSGGRPGIFLWVCSDENGERWEPWNLAAHHNALVRDPALHYAEPPQTTSYTGMTALGPDEVLLCYDRLANGWAGPPGPSGDADVVFTVRLKATRK